MLGSSPLDSFAITNASNTAAEASNRAEAAERHFRDLQARVDRLMLITEAMWSLLKEKTSVTETDLLSRVCDLELKQSDEAVVQCVACGRTIPARKNRCMYCGHTEPVQSIFQTL